MWTGILLSMLAMSAIVAVRYFASSGLFAAWTAKRFPGRLHGQGRQVRMEIYAGWVFVTLDPNAPPISETCRVHPACATRPLHLARKAGVLRGGERSLCGFFERRDRGRGAP